MTPSSTQSASNPILFTAKVVKEPYSSWGIPSSTYELRIFKVEDQTEVSYGPALRLRTGLIESLWQDQIKLQLPAMSEPVQTDQLSLVKFLKELGSNNPFSNGLKNKTPQEIGQMVHQLITELEKEKAEDTCLLSPQVRRQRHQLIQMLDQTIERTARKQKRLKKSLSIGIRMCAYKGALKQELLQAYKSKQVYIQWIRSSI